MRITAKLRSSLLVLPKVFNSNTCLAIHRYMNSCTTFESFVIEMKSETWIQEAERTQVLVNEMKTYAIVGRTSKRRLFFVIDRRKAYQLSQKLFTLFPVKCAKPQHFIFTHIGQSQNERLINGKLNPSVWSTTANIRGPQSKWRLFSIFNLSW